MAQLLIITISGVLLTMMLVFAVLDLMGMAAAWIGGASFSDFDD